MEDPEDTIVAGFAGINQSNSCIIENVRNNIVENTISNMYGFSVVMNIKFYLLTLTFNKAFPQNYSL